MMIFNKSKDNSDDKISKKNAVNTLKLGMMGSLLSKNKVEGIPEKEFQNELLGKIQAKKSDSIKFEDSDSVVNLTKIIQFFL